jgi:hypothetical protein
MGNRLLASFLAAAALIAFAGAVPTRVSAQGPTQPLVEVIDITVESVIVEDGQLIANAVVTLDVVGRTVTREVQIPLNVGGSPGAEGECDILNLSLGPVELNLLGLVVILDDCEGGPVTVDITAVEGGGLLGDLLCGIAGLLDSGVDLDTVLAGLTDAELAELTGAIEDVLNAVLDEVLMANVLAEHVAAASHQQGCDILTLQIPEGIHLNLLGLQVDTSGICLDIHAERGQGNLLGNLLCSLAHLLDNPGNNLGGQLAHVRSILRLLDRLGL